MTTDPRAGSAGRASRDSSAGERPPRTIAGRYRIVERLGRGGMGVVWRAHDDELGRDVAIKEFLLPDHLTDEQREHASRRALREAQAAAALRHQSIVGVHDVLLEDGVPCIVMDLLTGRSLDAVLADEGPLPPERVARIGLEILGALRTAHAHGVLHRDVKPANIFLREDGLAVLTDFGIAALEGEATLTRPGSLIGSPAYMAPERVREDDGGPASDLWSLGATLYTLTEGRPPFARSTLMATLGAVLADEPDPPRAAGPLEPLLRRLLVKDPEARLDAEATEEYLRSLVTGERAALPPAGTHPSPSPAGPHPSPSPVAAGVATVPAQPSSTGPSSTGRPWIVAAVVSAVAVVTLAAIATTAVVASRNGDDAAAPPPSPSRTASSSARASAPARFATAPSPCGLISAEQVSTLVREFTSHGDESSDPATGRPRKNCSWAASPTAEGSDEQLRLTLRTAADTSAALRLLTEERETVTGSVTPLPDLGEAAFAVSGPDDESSVHLTVDNLAVEVRYRSARERRDQLARRAARWALASLERS
ncbi:MAG TPA: serine/threonine-protein kinase [Spirillospora sp.]